MNEEAGFIAALLAEPGDRTTLLVYADWLDEHADPRGEYLRLLAADRPNRRRLAQLRRTLAGDWVNLIDTRYLCVGSLVRITDGAFRAAQGEVVVVAADRQNATVRLTFWGRPLEVQLRLVELELVPADDA